ncbi:MAG TPA: TGS domain-containing protein, partial [Flavobacteriales bacterium]|nr:TGS domain-containing protein [Flavobacteriales bacterium]
FTPKGELRTLPSGATALDFAFDIHSKVGESCIGAKVNTKLVPLSHPLNSGDQIEVITSKKQKPKEDWLKFVTTA